MENVTNNIYLRGVNWRKLMLSHLGAFVVGMGFMLYLITKLS